MYNPAVVDPMRQELREVGFTELTSETAVTDFFEKPGMGTALLVINSVCGCAAGAARPAVKLALATASKKPAHLVTVFAGQDGDATNKARSYLIGFPPSSPSMAVLKDGEVVKMIPRHEIEGRSAQQIAASLQETFNEFC